MFNRIKKPQKNSKKDDLHQDNPHFWQNDKFYAKRWNFINQRIESGTVLFHTCYEYFAIFAFVDNGEPHFANIDWEPTITTDNNPHMFRLATEEEATKFHQKMKENGFEFKNNRLYHNGKLINYPTTEPHIWYGKHRIRYKREKKNKLFYSGREY